ncbi:MAG: DUF222 domain-containing protein [Actinomycetota bacterium]|jgi:hypothetical protein|nr:DUF222 domain-containing protein [Actinomycetota bacterium]
MYDGFSGAPDQQAGLDSSGPSMPSAGSVPDYSALATEEIEAEVVELASRLAGATARLLGLIDELDRREVIGSWGCRSMAHWVSWRTGVSLSTAREQVRVARALRELPVISACLHAGELSYSKARALSSFATASSEADFVTLARHATAAQLDILARTRRRITNEDAVSAHKWRYLNWHAEEDGSVLLRARLCPEEAAVVIRAIEAFQTEDQREDASADAHTASEPGGEPEPWPEENNAEDASADAHQSEEGPSRGARELADHLAERHPSYEASRADALVAMAAAALANPGRPGAHPARVELHVDARVLAGDPPGGDARCDVDGLAVCAKTAERLCCEAEVSLVKDPSLLGTCGLGSSRLDLGRTRRLPSAAQRRALDARDKATCRFPGCDARRYLHAHHIVPWHQGGRSDLSNLALLCSGHHRLVHEGGWRLRGDPTGDLVATGPDGRSFSDILERQPGPVQVIEAPRPSGLLGGLISDPTGSIGGDGERMDVAYVFDVLLEIERQAEAREARSGSA